MTIIDRILLELSAKKVVEDGMPDFTNEKHLLALNEVLVDLDWSMEARSELLYSLIKEERDGDTIITYKDQDGDDQDVKLSTVRNYLSDKDLKINKNKQAAVKAANIDPKTGKDKPEPEKDKEGGEDGAPQGMIKNPNYAPYDRGNNEPEFLPDPNAEDPTEKPTEEPTEEPLPEPVDRSNFAEGTSQPKSGNKKKKRAAGFPKPDYPTQQEIHEGLNKGDFSHLQKDQAERRIDRDSGNAGAGGPVASKGESMYCDIVTNHDDDKFAKDEKDRIDEVKERDKFKNKKWNTAEQATLLALGIDPNSAEAVEYMSRRQAFAEKECERMQAMDKSVYNKTGRSGFGGDADDGSCNEDFIDWSKAAYDGGLETQRLLDDTPMVKEPRETIQSEPSTDDAVQAHLEDKQKELCDADPDGDDCLHYTAQLDAFSHNRKYHDTYIIGKDKNGRTYIVSVSNKKGSHMKDPQNNTTPRNRFKDIKADIKDSVKEEVITTLDESIELVSNVQQETRESSGNLTNPNSLAEHTTGTDAALSDSRRKDICDRGNKSTGQNRSTSFNRWIAKNYPNDNWDDVCGGDDDGKLLEIVGKYNADTDWHEENGEPGYDPFSKVFIKIGEKIKQRNLTQWKRDNPGRSVDEYNEERKAELEKKKDLTDEERCELMKLKEQEAVNVAHDNVINSINDADKGKVDEEGKPTYPDDKDGNNGPHGRAYIRSVMHALHFDRYINMSEEESKQMIVQMGIEGAKPDDFKACLAKLSGYEGDPVDPDELIAHIEKRCRVDKTTTPPSIVIKGNPKDKLLMEDTWRTAGTSQKVTSGIGQDIRDCIAERTKNRRVEKIKKDKEAKKGDTE